MFAIECWQANPSDTPRRIETIRAKLSHIRWCHQLVAGYRPSLAPQHELVIQGMRRLSPPRQQRGAVSTAMLTVIIKAANMSISQHRVLCGAAVLGFFFCLRGSEYLSSRGKLHVYCLQVRDIHVHDSNGVVTNKFRTATSVQITFRGSKTDQVGYSTQRTLLKSGQAPICPVFAALLLLRNAASLKLPSNSPICTASRHQVLSTESMTKTLRRAAERCSIPAHTISTHSLRTGGATALHSAGVDTDTIRMHGRWASDAYQAYIRETPAAISHLAKHMSRATSHASRRHQTDQLNGATRA
ncbi:hypothetical protein GN958_ATG22765 [Phytophthora infestans]|uniref:Tyr recombinase domain-containing protein n=1 Tax=Phytophthora infestans TaxID=4787 RepID=A0A8S9TM74_PHYIN|nr:hypothetical protein GN958_ATG22765 [Phytophthora infestans]